MSRTKVSVIRPAADEQKRWQPMIVSCAAWKYSKSQYLCREDRTSISLLETSGQSLRKEKQSASFIRLDDRGNCFQNRGSQITGTCEGS